MFNFFKKDKYKYSHSFYLPSGIYNGVIGKYNTITSETIKSFLTDNNFDVEDIKIDCRQIMEYLYSVTVKFKEEDKQAQFLAFLEQYKELFPPWKVFPDMLDGPRWNQGYQQDYGAWTWLPYLESLTDVEKEEHLDKYDCPPYWRNWLEYYEQNS